MPGKQIQMTAENMLNRNNKTNRELVMPLTVCISRNFDRVFCHCGEDSYILNRVPRVHLNRRQIYESFKRGELQGSLSDNLNDMMRYNQNYLILTRSRHIRYAIPYKDDHFLICYSKEYDFRMKFFTTDSVDYVREKFSVYRKIEPGRVRIHDMILVPNGELFNVNLTMVRDEEFFLDKLDVAAAYVSKTKKHDHESASIHRCNVESFIKTLKQDNIGGFSSNWPFVTLKGMSRNQYLLNANFVQENSELTELELPVSEDG